MAGIGNLAALWGAKRRGDKLDASEAQNKADAEAKAQAAKMQQGALVKALFEAQQGGNYARRIIKDGFQQPRSSRGCTEDNGTKAG